MSVSVKLHTTFFSLGEKISDEKLDRKIFRSLPKSFDMKFTTIKEGQDTSTIKVDELISSLLTFEMAIMTNLREKNSVVLKVDVEEDEDHEEGDVGDNITELYCSSSKNILQGHEEIDIYDLQEAVDHLNS